MFEAVGVRSEGGSQGFIAFAQDVFCEIVMHVGWGHEADFGMVMFVVVPGKKRLAMDASVFDTAEASGKCGSVFHGFKLRF